jgi:hypothetical protein
MDFSGDVKQAIPRPAVAFGNVGPSPLIRGWQEFRRSGTPVRFLCFEGGAWADVEAEAAAPLRRAFLERRVVAEAAYAGRAFLFDFLRMARIDAATAEAVPMGWIDDRGACFFPVPDNTGRNKRKRAQQPELEDGASSSSGVEEGSGESSGDSDAAESGRASKAARGAWGKALKLDETDKFYQVVKKLFLSGIAPRAGGAVAITAVHKVAQGPRSRAFQLQGQLLAAARGEGGGNAKFAWYGGPVADVAAAVEHGFGKTNSRVLGTCAHGDGVHLSPPQSPYTR